jgi:hypothetical protein
LLSESVSFPRLRSVKVAADWTLLY